MAEGSKFDAPAVHDDKAIREEKKKCVTCGIEVDFHLGPTGPGRCFGKALTGCFENLLHTVCAMQKTILEEREEAKKEREEAKDREKRLSIKVSKLSLKLEKNEELLDKALEKMESLEKSLALTKTAGTGAIDPGKKVTKKKNKQTQEQRNKKLTERSWVDDGSTSSSEDDKHANGQGKHGEVEKETSLREESSLSTGGTKSTKVEHEGGRGSNSTKGTKRTQVKPAPKFDPIASDDESWNLVVERKPSPPKAVLYIGNLSPKTTAENLEKFVTERTKSLGVDTPRIFNSRVYENQKDENASSSSGTGARITIPVEAVPTLTSRSFWPRPAYARPWVFKESQLDKPQPLLLESHKLTET